MRKLIHFLSRFIGLEIRRVQTDDPIVDIKTFLKDRLAPVIFDVGGYRGDLSIKYLHHFPDVELYVFEPFSGSFKYLESRIGSDARVKLFHVGISDHIGTALMHVHQDLSRNSIFPAIESEQHTGTSELIDLTTIDEIISRCSINSIDVLKLDVEGMEKKALIGASRALSRADIKILFTELVFTPHYQGGILYHEVVSYLAEYGYTLFNFYELKSARNHQLRWGNALFVSPAMRKRITTTSI